MCKQDSEALRVSADRDPVTWQANMKYTIKETSDGSYVLMRYGKPAAKPQPNNAELEFWFRIQALQLEIERLNNLIGGATNE